MGEGPAAQRPGRAVACQRLSDEPSAALRQPNRWSDQLAWNLCGGEIHYQRM